MRPVLLSLLVLSTACFGGGPDPIDSDLLRTQLRADKPFVRDVVGGPVTTQAREMMRFVSDGGTVNVLGKAGKTPFSVAFRVEMAGFQVGDLPTLDRPLGFVKLATLSGAASVDAWTAPITDIFLRRLGSPIQLTFESQTTTAIEGRLVDVDSRATAKLLGVFQIDDRQVNTEVNVQVVRVEPGVLAVQILPTQIDLSELGLEPYLAALSKALGGKVEPRVTLEGSLRLMRFEGASLPSFVRTPVTIRTVADVAAQIDREVDDVDAAKEKLIRRGADPDMVEAAITEETLRIGEEMLRKYKEDARAPRSRQLDER